MTKSRAMGVVAFRVLSTAIYWVLGIGVVLGTLGAVGPSGDRFEYRAVYVDLGRGTAFYTLVPAALLIVIAFLAILDTAPRVEFRSYIAGPLVGSILAFAGSGFGLIAFGISFLPAAPGDPGKSPPLQDGIRPTVWFVYSFCLPMLIYFAFALVQRFRQRLSPAPGPRDPGCHGSWRLHAIVGMLPTVWLGAVAFALFQL